VVVAVVAILTLVKVTQWITNEWKIRTLGGHAHRIRTWLPGGMYPFLHVSRIYIFNCSQMSTSSPKRSAAPSTIRTSKSGTASTPPQRENVILSKAHQLVVDVSSPLIRRTSKLYSPPNSRIMARDNRFTGNGRTSLGIRFSPRI